MSLLGFSFVACLASCGVPVKFNHQPCLWTIPPSCEVEACSRQRTSVCYTYPSRVLFLLQLRLSFKMEIQELSEHEKAVLSTGQTEANSLSPSLSVGDQQQLPPPTLPGSPAGRCCGPALLQDRRKREFGQLHLSVSLSCFYPPIYLEMRV